MAAHIDPPPLGLSAACIEVSHQNLSDINAPSLTVPCNLADPEVSPIIKDHTINGNELAPSGLHGDMTQTVAKYLWKRPRPAALQPAINACDMHVNIPFIPALPAPDTGEWFNMDAVADLRPADDHQGSVRFTFRKPDDPKPHVFAGCTVTYRDAWL